MLFGACFYALFFFQPPPFQKPFSALVIQPERGLLSFPSPTLYERVHGGCPPETWKGDVRPQGAALPVNDYMDSCPRRRSYGIQRPPAWNFRTVQVCVCVHTAWTCFRPAAGGCSSIPGTKKPVDMQKHNYFIVFPIIYFYYKKITIPTPWAA